MLVVWRVGEAYWVDELPAADFQRTRVTRNAPRVERSDRTCTPNPHQEQGLLFNTLPSPHRTIKYQAKSGVTSTGPGGHHNRRPTGGVLLYSKPIRCNVYPTKRPLRKQPGKLIHKKGS